MVSKMEKVILHLMTVTIIKANFEIIVLMAKVYIQQTKGHGMRANFKMVSTMAEAY